MRADAAARTALGLLVATFLVVGDVWFPPGSPWHAVRLPLLGAALVAASVVLARDRGRLVTMLRFPLAPFTAFAAIDLVAAAFASQPLRAMRYATGYVAVEAMAVAVACSFTEKTLAAGLLVTVAVKTFASLALVLLPFTWWSETRFMGLLGNPNPMGAAAVLVYLLIALRGWYDWRRPVSRMALVAIGMVATTTLALTRSVSALVAMVATLVLVAPACRVRESGWKARAAWAAASALMLLPLATWSPGGPAAPAGPAESVNLRSGWWALVMQAIWQHPWLGHGAGSAPALAMRGAPPWGTSAHNLYLEAAVYAGIPAAIAMAAFVVCTVAAAMAGAARSGGGRCVGLAVPVVVYAVLSLVEPVVLNGTPSSLVVPLVAAAALSMPRTGDRAGSAEP